MSTGLAYKQIDTKERQLSVRGGRVYILMEVRRVFGLKNSDLRTFGG